jgi:WD40 repeat protein
MKRFLSTILFLSLLAFLLVIPTPVAHADPLGTWSLTGSMNVNRENHTATLLPNGNVLVTGGSGAGTSAELYDPSSGIWTLTGSMNVARQAHTATLQPNGQVLVTGGSSPTTLASAELYDPSSGTWSLTGTMNNARVGHTATLLPNGQVLVAGGYLSGTSSAELYDPSSGTWTLTGTMNVGRYYDTATLLPNSQVLVAGGCGGCGNPLASAELFSLNANSAPVITSASSYSIGMRQPIIPANFTVRYNDWHTSFGS